MARIADILASKGPQVHQIPPESKVYDAIALMSEKGIGALLVVGDEVIQGIITERDYLRKVALEGRSSQETEVRQIMSSHLIYATPDQDIQEVLAVMTEARIRHVPVMDEKALVGLVSIGDCVKQLSRDRAAEIRYLKDYIGDNYPG